MSDILILFPLKQNIWNYLKYSLANSIFLGYLVTIATAFLSYLG